MLVTPVVGTWKQANPRSHWLVGLVYLENSRPGGWLQRDSAKVVFRPPCTLNISTDVHTLSLSSSPHPPYTQTKFQASERPCSQKPRQMALGGLSLTSGLSHYLTHSCTYMSSLCLSDGTLALSHYCFLWVWVFCLHASLCMHCPQRPEDGI